MNEPEVIEIIQYIDDENWEEEGGFCSDEEEVEVIKIEQVQVVVPPLRRRSSVTIAPHEVGIGQKLDEIIVESSHGTRYHQRYSYYRDGQEEDDTGKVMVTSSFHSQGPEESAGEDRGFVPSSNDTTATTTSAGDGPEEEEAPTQMEMMFAAHMETLFANHKVQILQNENMSLRGLVQTQTDQINELQKTLQEKVERLAMVELELDLCRADNQALIYQQQQLHHAPLVQAQATQQPAQHNRRVAYLNNNVSAEQVDGELAIATATTTAPSQEMKEQVRHSVAFNMDIQDNHMNNEEYDVEEEDYKGAHDDDEAMNDNDQYDKESTEEKALRQKMLAELRDLDRQIAEAKVEKKRRESMIASSSAAAEITTTAIIEGPALQDRHEGVIATSTTKTTTTTAAGTGQEVLKREDSITSRTSRCSDDDDSDSDSDTPAAMSALSACASMRMSLVAAKAVKRLKERLVTAQLKLRLKEHAEKKKKEALESSKNPWQEIIGAIGTARQSLRPLPKSLKRDSTTWINNDHPYMRELREVQAEVLPMWRKETYDYWI